MDIFLILIEEEIKEESSNDQLDMSANSGCRLQTQSLENKENTNNFEIDLDQGS